MFVVIVVVKKPFSFSTSLAFKVSSSSRILSSFSDFLVSCSEISSNSTPSFVGLGDAPLLLPFLYFAIEIFRVASQISLSPSIDLLWIWLQLHCWSFRKLCPNSSSFIASFPELVKLLYQNFFAQQHVVRCCPLNWPVVKISTHQLSAGKANWRTQLSQKE